MEYLYTKGFAGGRENTRIVMLGAYSDSIRHKRQAVIPNPGLSWALIPTGSEGSPEVADDVMVSFQPLLCFLVKLFKLS